MDVGEALRRRRMVRRYTGDPIDHDAADRIARATESAPTAGNSQGITVISITDPDTIAEVAVSCGETSHLERGFDPWLSTSGQMLALCAEPDRYRSRYSEPDKDPAVLESVPWWWVDAGAALMGALVTAVAEGLGAGFLGGHATTGARALLGIPDEVLLVGIITIGHPVPDRRSGSLDRPTRPDRIRRDRW